MAIRVALNHRTEYCFDRRVALSPHVIRLRPAPHTRSSVSAYSLNISPGEHFINWQQDPFGNWMARVVFPEKAENLKVEVDLVVGMTTINPFDFFVEEYADDYPFHYEAQLQRELAPYLKINEDGKHLRAWLAKVDKRPRNIVDFLVALNQRLQHEIAYTIRMEPGVQSCETTLARSLGSCRDSAWLLVQILRHLGLAARFASGYLIQLKADNKALDGPSGTEQDFTDLHAWCEVFIPGAGWVGLDPTSGLFAGEGHIPLACTPDPVSAAPISGFTDECEVAFEHSNTVRRIHEDPRVTKPYSEPQWGEVMALGQQVDDVLQAEDVRLTMGGEPTFVSIDDMESEQWNNEALGDDKRRIAGQLLQGLQQRFAPGGLCHYGQGKWYPGEPLPRWALSCFWRKDGRPVWRNQERLAVEDNAYGHQWTAARRFAETLAEQLQIPQRYLIEAYEDALYYLWKEASLPEDIDPLQADLKDGLERRRIARVLDHGLDEPVGLVLPLRRNLLQQCWESSAWPLRRERLFLLPGDSATGYRLPLNALPWHASQDLENRQYLRDPFETRAALDDYHRQEAGSAPLKQSLQHYGGGNVIQTALCLEIRNETLHVFMPPLSHLEDYLQLLACIERCAEHLQLSVRIEGYEPPADPRLQRLQVTPDPGVIEVNIHPSASWQELVDNTDALYEEARQVRLATEKFMLDGRHSGTGGGNHVTIGAANIEDSPILRRPDLLRSLLTYWQHHPALSYLFSGAFIGPTSQAPRVDEGRDETLYELEIAFSQMPEGECPQPWLVDRILRNLLVDITGNTHRAEFCIDKLYSPDSVSGRLGLLEFRGFEMPPHARMSLVQTLLLRTLIARFWREPYQGDLVRWGTELHDRFMLPHYIEADLRDVCDDLQRAGFAFQHDWLAPFLNFRFPYYGDVQLGDISLQLHWAIEPWHVLGEEMSGQGTARYVDSSVERLQVKVTGLTDGRHVLCCNGRRVPLRSTGTCGEFVAGIRYKAWAPASALHPSIDSHPPLVFDLIDTWNQRSLGGCVYHVAHPGGRNYEVFPVNAYEAEGRRLSRFWGFGHTPGDVNVPPAESSAEYPHTLDLRRPPPSR